MFCGAVPTKHGSFHQHQHDSLVSTPTLTITGIGFHPAIIWGGRIIQATFEREGANKITVNLKSITCRKLEVVLCGKMIRVIFSLVLGVLLYYDSGIPFHSFSESIFGVWHTPFRGVECMLQHALHSMEWVCLDTLQAHSSIWIFPPSTWW